VKSFHLHYRFPSHKTPLDIASEFFILKSRLQTPLHTYLNQFLLESNYLWLA